MAGRDTPDEPDAKTIADLSALADGTLDPARVAEVREQIARSPELTERFGREQQAVQVLRATRTDVAPSHLRSRIEAERTRATGWRGTRPSNRLIRGGALVGAAAAVIVALALVLPGGSPGAPSVGQAASLAFRGPVLGAPAVDQTGTKLSRELEDVYFPNWSRRGWTAAGQRSDELGGRTAVTVYYNRGGTEIAYTILSRPALNWPGAQTRWLRGTKVQSFRLDGRTVVTWRRGNNTCILSGAGVSTHVLSGLAAWKLPGFEA
jgi:hypothetical protein